MWDEFGGEEPEHGASDLGVGLLDGLLLAEHLVPVEGDHAELYLPREGSRKRPAETEKSKVRVLQQSLFRETTLNSIFPEKVAVRDLRKNK